MIADMHTHVLPGIDDGSPDVGVSLEMLRTMEGQQIRRVAATPHFYAAHDTPERFLRRREEALRALGPVEGLELRLGAEVHYFEGISDCDALEDLAIEGTGLLLVEMPGTPWPERSFDALLEIRRKRGLIPVIAHIDRYITPLRSYGIPERLARLPVLVQLNSGALLRRSTRAMALRLIRQGRVHLLGSDCHGMEHRKPDLAQAWKIIGDKLGRSAQEELLRLEETIWKKS